MQRMSLEVEAMSVYDSVYGRIAIVLILEISATNVKQSI